MKKFLILCLLTVSALAAPPIFKIKTQDSFTATTVSSKVLDEEPYRIYLLCQNNGAVSVNLKFESAHVASEGIIIPSGGYYEPVIAPSGAVYLKAASGSADVACTEGIR